MLNESEETNGTFDNVNNWLNSQSKLYRQGARTNPSPND